MRVSALLALMGLLVIAGRISAGEPPDRHTVQEDQKRLDSLEKKFFETQAKDQQFGEEFWLDSRRVGEETGPRILYALMERSKRWRDEAGLIFVPLVALLPRKPTLAMLHDFEHSRQELVRVWAREFLIEMLDMDDTRAAVRKYSRDRR